MLSGRHQGEQGIPPNPDRRGGEGRPEPRIAAAGSAEVEIIAGLAGRIWRCHYPGIIPREQIEYMLGCMYAHETLRGELARGFRYDLVRVGETVAGFAGYEPDHPSGETKLHKLYVDPAFQRQGLGTLLLTHVERISQSLGRSTVFLTVNKNNHLAIAAYRKNGYRIRESVVMDIGAGFVMDDFIMAKSL